MKIEIRDQYYLKKLRNSLFSHDATIIKATWMRVYLPLPDKYYPSGPLCCTVLPISQCPKDKTVGICPEAIKAKEILARRKDESKN